MFTGLIADIGTIKRVRPGDRATTLTIETGLARDGFTMRPGQATRRCWRLSAASVDAGPQSSRGPVQRVQ